MFIYMRFVFVLMAMCCAFVTSNTYAAVQEIAAVVNDGAISMRDLDKRMKLIMVSSGLQNSQEIRDRLKPQVLGSLVNEQLMMQEARRLDISVDKAEIEGGLAKISQQNNTSPEKFKAMLSRGGIDIGTMYAQIEAQIAWGKVVQSQLRSKVIISDRDVDDMLERIKSKIGTTEYLAAEIFLPVEGPKKASQSQQLANRLVSEIRSGKASFFKLATQFSQAAGSTNGGDIGWVQDTQLPQELLDGLKKVKKGQVTNPIKSPNGYHILFLRDTRTVADGTIPSRDQVYYNIGSERLDKLQRRHLMDLRAASFVDIRV